MGSCFSKRTLLSVNSSCGCNENSRDENSSQIFSESSFSSFDALPNIENIETVNKWVADADQKFLDFNYIINIPDELQKLINATSTDQGWLYTLHSLINVVGDNLHNESVFNDTVRPTIILLVIEDSPLPTKNSIADLHQLLQPFLSLSIHSPFDASIVRQRNMCTVLSYFAERLAGELSIDLLSIEILKCLERIVRENLNPSLVLFALNCLEKFAITGKNKQTIAKKIDLTRELVKLEKYVDEYTLPRLYCGEPVDFLRYQVGFCAQWCLDNVFIKKGRVLSYKKVDYSNLNVVLNVNDKTESLKLSSNGLSVRCDSTTFECIRSTYPVTEGVFFYEAIVLTSGIMQIGWATKATSFRNHEGHGVGDDSDSIAFDGCRSVIWHNTEHYRHGLTRWAPGDVLGCLIDVPNRKFIFYLNGKKVELTKAVMKKLRFQFSEKPYYAAASLMSYQQCYFNFGQSPFKYPPKRYKFKDLNSQAINVNKDDFKVVPMHIKMKSFSITSFISKKNACNICYDRSSSIQLVPCGHENVCSECVLMMNTCPFCRDPFTSYKRI